MNLDPRIEALADLLVDVVVREMERERRLGEAPAPENVDEEGRPNDDNTIQDAGPAAR